MIFFFVFFFGWAQIRLLSKITNVVWFGFLMILLQLWQGSIHIWRVVRFYYILEFIECLVGFCSFVNLSLCVRTILVLSSFFFWGGGGVGPCYMAWISRKKILMDINSFFFFFWLGCRLGPNLVGLNGAQRGEFRPHKKKSI